MAAPATHTVALHVATRSPSKQNWSEVQCCARVEVVPSVPHIHTLPPLQNVVSGTQPMSWHTPALHVWYREQVWATVKSDPASLQTRTCEPSHDVARGTQICGTHRARRSSQYSSAAHCRLSSGTPLAEQSCSVWP